jgi:hypothetical protein
MNNQEPIELKLRKFIKKIFDNEGTCQQFQVDFTPEEIAYIASLYGISSYTSDIEVCNQIVNKITQDLLEAHQKTSDELASKSMEELPPELFENISERLGLADYINVLGIFTENEDSIYAKSKYRQRVSKITLDKARVDYEDPKNFIYLAGEISRNNFLPEGSFIQPFGDGPREIPRRDDGDLDYESILGYYLRFYGESVIKYTSADPDRSVNVKITSFPVYPNMISCDLSGNLLTQFLIQPNMKMCVIQNNRLAVFPVQPLMENCDLTFNLLETFEVQPKMSGCVIMNNRLTSFPEQSEMTVCELSGNQLTSFPKQPSMISCIINNNQLTSFEYQPKLTRLDLRMNPNLVSIRRQPLIRDDEDLLVDPGLQIVDE